MLQINHDEYAVCKAVASRWGGTATVFVFLGSLLLVLVLVPVLVLLLLLLLVLLLLLRFLMSVRCLSYALLRLNSVRWPWQHRQSEQDSVRCRSSDWRALGFTGASPGAGEPATNLSCGR